MSSDFNTITDNNIMIVKARFKSSAMNLYGQILLVFNNNGEMENFNLAVSTYSDAYDLELHTSWEKYEEFIADLKWKGHFNNSMTTSLMNQFKELNTDINLVKRFYESVYNYDYDSLDITLYDMINRVVHEKNLILESVIQEVTPAEFADIKDRRNKPVGDDNSPSGETTNQYGLGTGAVILSVKPLLAPVKGKPIYELRLSDHLMVKVTPNSDLQNHYIDQLQMKEDNQIRPIPGEVIDIKAGTGKNDPIEILVRIAPNIYGKIIENEKQVKLRMYNPTIDGLSLQGDPKKSKPKPPGAAAPGDMPIGLSKGTVIMLLLFIFILIMFTVLIFLSW